MPHNWHYQKMMKLDLPVKDTCVEMNKTCWNI